MNTSCKAAVASLLACAVTIASTSHRPQPLTSSQLPVSSEQRVTLNVTVTDKVGWFVAGLQGKDFEVSVDKKPAQIVSVDYADDPVSIGLVFDLSGSIAGSSESKAAKTLVVLRESLKQFVGSGHQENQYFLVAFNKKSQLLSDWTSEYASLVERFSGLDVYGHTAMYDAVHFAVNKLEEGRHAKRAIILVSDGQDNSSLYTFRKVRDSLRERNVLLYAIDLPTKYDASSMGAEGRDILDDLTATSGGRAFLTKEGDSRKEKDVGRSLEAIARELRSQYTISIVTKDSKAGKTLNRIKVKVSSPVGATGPMKELKARTREGFYAG